MFKLLDRLKKGSGKLTGKESTISSEQLLNTKDEETNQSVKTGLSIHPQANLSQEDQYFFQFLHNDLPDLKENQISISGVDLKNIDGHLHITAFVRNSLNKSIKLQASPLLLIDHDANVIARKEFDLSLLGEIPARSSRPWEFQFSLEEMKVTEIPHTGWNLAFELSSRTPHSLELEESWKKSLATEEINSLEKLVQSLQIPKPGEVNFLGIKVKFDQEGKLHTTILIRNGSNKSITLQQLPIAVEDASGELVAKGAFTLNNLQVKANTSKPWTFIFPETLIIEKNPDFSRWKAFVLQN